MLRLTEIELWGFKSFPDRTRVPLPGDILIVVGPNGAGKSNVTDAVLWALGEQSAKTLRGHKMLDVIFSGSHKRPPAGMAEVLLSFEDTEGDKVQIGRRLLRTGDSSYLMDGRPVRLKDVHDFLMRYAISTQGSFLVEQGRVEALLQASPEERRMIFEEVAGIAHFKENRRTALQKLESTQANLLRINDIVAEVEGQMGTLKRQAAKADRFVRLSDELRQRRRSFWGRSFGKLTAQRAALAGDLDLFREERLRRDTALSRLQSELEQASAGLSEHEGSLAALIQTIHGKELESERAEQENKRRTEQILSGKNRLRQIAGDREEVQRRAEGARGESARLAEECAVLEAEVARADAAAEEARTAVENGKSRVEALEAAQAGLRQKAFALAQEHSRLATTLARLEEDLRRLGERQHRFEREEEGLSAREAALEERRAELVAAKEATDARLEAAGRARLDAEAAADALQASLEAAAGELAAAREEAASAESRLQVLVSHEASLRSSAHAFLSKKAPERAGKTLAEGLAGVPDDLLPAVTASLSGILDAYLESPWDGLEGLLADLRGTRAGEAVFFLKGAGGRRQPPPKEASSHKGFSGWLHEAQGMPTALRPVLPLVALVADAEAARAFAARTALPAVSRDGCFVHPDGWVRGGAGGPGGAALLEHRRDVKKSQSALDGAKERLARADAEHGRLRAGLEAQRATAAQTRTDEQSVAQEALALARDVEALESEARRLEASRSLLEGEAAQAREERRAWEEQRDQLRRDLEASERAGRALEGEVKAGEEALGAARLAQEKGHERVAETRSGQSASTQRLSGVQAALRAAREREAELEATDRRLLQEAQGLEARVAALTSDVTEGDRTLRTLLLGLEESRQRKARFEEELRRLQEDVQGRQRLVKDAREALDEAREQVSGHELTLASVDADLRNLVERMGEVFEEDPAALAEECGGQEPLSDEERQAEHKALQRMEERIGELGAVNMLAREEYAELEKRFEFLSTQRADLEEAVASLQETIRKINRTTRERFMEAFEAVQGHFVHLFKEVFEGGEARLSLLDEANPLDTGVEIYAQPPGKKLQSIQLLSGGEKAMVALALLFSLFRYRPQPFFILDEVDAPLDEANINRFNRLLSQFRGQTQFLVVSHNKRTMELAEVLYGVTMAEGGVSRVVSVRLAEVEERLGVGGKA